ncbi:CMRF35-like molecule 1 [Orycteropus afer afer]|uniref:CMRF35-like molecule 1 n=1 Tax=Orycteropus afer afer TaxID=1230840 RepID=A0A8B7BD30_ORYAF|nr:CMRF35-like molecule 1 [Orycteropus afer afer]
MSGPKGGSLTVQCHYDSGWENHYKWWCRGAVWSTCKILVRTTGSELEVKKDRISIKDNHTDLMFTVIMEKLREDDADVYWCGIERFGTDCGVEVKVSVSPAPATPEEITGSMTSYLSDDRRKTNMLRILLPLVFAVFLLLLVVASLVAWRMMKQQKKASGTSSEQVLQPLEGDLCYANLALNHTGPLSASSQKKDSRKSASSVRANQVEVEYVIMELTYSNTGHLVADIPMGSHEEPIEYSTIRKP